MTNRAILTLLIATGVSVHAEAARFNDTGLSACIVESQFSRNCSGSGQDAEFGRDTNAPSPKNGTAGFAFTKIDFLGRGLPRGAAEWSCVKDEVTGLTWEKKSLDPTNLHYFASEKTYFPKGPGYPPNDIRFFVEDVNAEQYCGFSDWRVPTKDEALSLVSYNLVKDGRKYKADGLDRTFFADPSYGEWTKECDNSTCALTLFENGFTRLASRLDSLAYARLVRGKFLVADNARFVTTNSQVRDKVSGVSWSRCAEGQIWLDNTCVGTANAFTWQQALAVARQRSLDSGIAWRLPNIKELLAVTNYPFGADATAFPNAQSQLLSWSSTASFDPAAVRSAKFGVFSLGSIPVATGTGFVYLVHD